MWWPESRIKKGDWYGVQFYSPYLAERFRRIYDGEMFNTKRLGDIADVGPNGRTITMYMKRSDAPGRYCWESIYGNETGRITSMRAEPYTYVKPKCGKTKEARRFWSRRATLLLPERIQPNITRAAAINSTIPTVGTSWTGVRPRGNESLLNERVGGWTEAWPKAMAVYLNSTPGIIALLGVRIPRKLMYPTYSLEENQRRIPVPHLTQAQVVSMATAYDRLAGRKLGLWRDHADKVRTQLDGVVCKTLGLDAEDVARMRRELSREPMVTGRQYGEPPSITDKYE